MGEVARESSLSAQTARLLFDENLTGLGKALRWVYKSERIVLSLEQLGQGAPDADIIRFCRDNSVVWVTRDWAAAEVDQRVAQLKADGVSAWWLRQEHGKRQMRRREQLWIAARDIDNVILAVETASSLPLYLASSIGVKSRQIRLPFVRPRARKVRRPRPRKLPRGIEPESRLFGP